MSVDIDPQVPDSLRTHLDTILEFYHPDCLDDENGGYIAQFDERTGTIYDSRSKHLVAMCRFIRNYSIGYQHGRRDWSRSAVEHGLEFLRSVQWDDDHEGFHWIITERQPTDRRRLCYGHAFGLLALARAAALSIRTATNWLPSVARVIDERFWEPTHGLYRSEYDAEWTSQSAYRGQNANMHMCEALIAAYETTGDRRYLERALTVAETVTVELATPTDGMVWEHYTEDWEPDFEYNRDNPDDTFRPWGFQPGHQIEWAKLLAILSRHSDESWLCERASELFEAAVTHGWDDQRGGLYYSVDLECEPVVTEKYSWEVAEAIGAAIALYERTENPEYLAWYERFWSYATTTMITPRQQNWVTKVTAENDPVPTRSGIAVEPGYHPIGACFEAIRSL